MPTIQLEINVPEFTEDELRAAILEACVDHVLGQGWEWKQDDSEDEPVRVKAKSGWFIDEMRKAVREVTLQRVQAVVELAVGPLVQALLDQPFRTMDRWGNEARETTTLREMIVAYGRDYLTEPVQDNGRPDTSYGARERSQSRLRWMVNETTKAVYDAELKTLVQKAAAEVKTELAGKVTATVAEAVLKLLNLEKGR